MQAVKEILAAHGFDNADAMTVEDHIEVAVDGFMPLVIEKLAEDRVSVAHYYTQMGDLMSDPEIVFRVEGSEWVPVEYTQHPHIYQHNESGLPGAADFANAWSRKLKRQGFVEAAREAASASQQVTA